jgi:hypothetical protein
MLLRPAARVWMLPMFAACAGAQRQDLVDHQRLAVKCLLDVAAHRTATAMNRQCVRQVADGVARSDPQPQIPVFDVELAALVEQARGYHHIAAGEDRQRLHRVFAVEELTELIRRGGRVVGCTLRRVVHRGERCSAEDGSRV